MYFRQIIHEEKSCLSYLVGCQTENVCAVIDPQGNPDFYIRKAEDGDMKIIHIFETHLQADHHSGAQELAQATGAALYLGPGSGAGFKHMELNDGQTIKMGGRKFKIFHTPGHTPEHVCILVDEWFLLTGDTLFVGDVGRVDLEAGGDLVEKVERGARELHQSLQRLLALRDSTEIYPAHFGGSVCGRGIDGKPISTIGRERLKNPALKMSLEEFVAFQMKEAPPLPKNLEDIKKHNAGIR